MKRERREQCVSCYFWDAPPVGMGPDGLCRKSAPTDSVASTFNEVVGRAAILVLLADDEVNGAVREVVRAWWSKHEKRLPVTRAVRRHAIWHSTSPDSDWCGDYKPAEDETFDPAEDQRAEIVSRTPDGGIRVAFERGGVWFVGVSNVSLEEARAIAKPRAPEPLCPNCGGSRTDPDCGANVPAPRCAGPSADPNCASPVPCGGALGSAWIDDCTDCMGTGESAGRFDEPPGPCVTCKGSGKKPKAKPADPVDEFFDDDVPF